MVYKDEWTLGCLGFGFNLGSSGNCSEYKYGNWGCLKS